MKQNGKSTRGCLDHHPPDGLLDSNAGNQPMGYTGPQHRTTEVPIWIVQSARLRTLMERVFALTAVPSSL